MIKRIAQLPAVLTSFAYREDYFPEIEAMLATVKEHHPDWSVVSGKGPVAGFELPTLEVESPAGKFHWSLPVSLNPGSEKDDWRKITMMKGWWLARLWQNLSLLSSPTGSQLNRIIWLDADSRLNGPLDITLEPEAEMIAGAWCDDDQQVPGYAHILSGLLVLQGSRQGAISALLDQWSAACLERIQNLSPASVPWGDGDQEVLTEILQIFPGSNNGYTLLKLEEEKYTSCPMVLDKFMHRSLIDHWDMGSRMKMPQEQRDPDWPPSEEFRRTAVIGAPLPGMPWELRPRRIYRLPAVLTSFAYGEEYFPEIESMLATVKEHHPGWSVVIGKGPIAGFELPTLEVESPAGKFHWSLPVSLNLSNEQDDWRKITMMKGWWLAKVWQNLSLLCGSAHSQPNRVVWLDADARLKGPLDVILAPQAEVIAGVWCYDDNDVPGDANIRSGLLLLQGSKQGTIAALLDQWSAACLNRIQNLPPATVPWGDGDQEVLTEILKTFPESNGDYTLLRLEEEKYGNCPISGGQFMRQSLINHWDMSTRMKKPPGQRDGSWPPAEEFRRTAAIGTPVPGLKWTPREKRQEHKSQSGDENTP
ncbi:MAG TPA: hypothetical protein VI685_23275 [Candidatus Angelobacter sp.]